MAPQCIKLNKHLSVEMRVFNCILQSDQFFSTVSQNLLHSHGFNQNHLYWTVKILCWPFNSSKCPMTITRKMYILKFYDADNVVQSATEMKPQQRCRLPKRPEIATTSQNKSCQQKTLETCKFSVKCNLLSCESQGCDVVDNV